MSIVDLHHALFVGNWAVHFAFVAYVVTGSAVVVVAAARRGDGEPGPLETVFTDWLPVALSGAITAAVAPLLFVQTLHPEAFYSASILLFWRAVPLLPALVAGFYLLYVVKAKTAGRVRAAAAAGSLGCWLFAAFTWTSIHLLSGRPDDWPGVHADGAFAWSTPGLVPRLFAWLALMVPAGLASVVWQVRRRAGVPWRAMAAASIAGSVVAIGCGILHLQAAGTDAGSWGLVAAAGLIVTAAGWLPALAGRGGGLVAAVTSLGVVVTLTGAALFREATRGGLPTDPVASVQRGQGLWVFVVHAVLITVALAVVLRGVARDLRATSA